MIPTKNPAAVALGALGGKVKSQAKAAACRRNGRLGGRPKKRVGAIAQPASAERGDVPRAEERRI